MAVPEHKIAGVEDALKRAQRRRTRASKTYVRPPAGPSRVLLMSQAIKKTQGLMPRG